MFQHRFVAALAACVIPFAAQADQFQATGGIFDGSAYGRRYVGAGGTSALYNQPFGEVVDGGHGAFDAFGFYNSGVGSLVQARQVELLSGNVFRFLDTFTNGGASSVTTTLNFFGNLGSDGDELVSLSTAGLMVSCEDDGTGQCGSDPVLALVSGNNGLGRASITPDRYNVGFTVTLAPGASLSLLNFAFLASDAAAGPTAADVLLAQTTGQSLLASPRLDGLSSAQIAGIANFAQPVPEPSTWALMGLGLAGLGLARRRLRR